MKKIEFKDLPSKETPLSANNLNLLQQNVEDEINKKANKEYVDSNKATKAEVEFIKNNYSKNKSVISIYKKEDQIFQMGDNVGRGVDFNTVNKNIWDAFKISRNTIIVKKNCTVKISYGLFMDHAGGYVMATLYRRRAGNLFVANMSIDHRENLFKYLGVGGIIVEVKENDDIMIDVAKTASDQLKIRGGYQYNFLTVEEI